VFQVSHRGEGIDDADIIEGARAIVGASRRATYGVVTSVPGRFPAYGRQSA
jgi:hypothetical protein